MFSSKKGVLLIGAENDSNGDKHTISKRAIVIALFLTAVYATVALALVTYHVVCYCLGGESSAVCLQSTALLALVFVGFLALVGMVISLIGAHLHQMLDIEVELQKMLAKRQKPSSIVNNQNRNP